MQKKLQVFVSSTYIDMKDERAAAVEAILKADHIPAGMELFAAGSESQWETIKRWIDASDVFLLILGGRYGTIEPTSGKSYIELEYQYAKDKHKEFFAVVMDKDSLEKKVKKFGSGVLELEHSAHRKEFYELVLTKNCEFFKDVKDLKMCILHSLRTFEKDESLVGWIRGNEVKELQSELTELKTSLRGRNTSTSREENEVVLTTEAQLLLSKAAKGDGTITIYNLGELKIFAGGTEYCSSETQRDKAKWMSVVNDLRTRHLIEDTGPKNGLVVSFILTAIGFTLVDSLQLASQPEA